MEPSACQLVVPSPKAENDHDEAELCESGTNRTDAIGCDCHVRAFPLARGVAACVQDTRERMPGDAPNIDVMKELAIEQLFAAVKEVRANPDNKQPLEDLAARRAKGRSEQPDTLDEQLQSGLEDTFPAS